MDRETRRALGYRRTDAGPIENNLIDELVNGELDRAEFLRRGMRPQRRPRQRTRVRRRAGRPDDRTATRTVKAGARCGQGSRLRDAEPYLLNDGAYRLASIR
jgi:hypothetical protein